jgi:hypothetical protein
LDVTTSAHRAFKLSNLGEDGHMNPLTRDDDDDDLPGEILDVKRGMVENIDRVLDRGEKIDLLVDKAATLHSDAFRFKRTTRQVRRTFWWQHCGYMVRKLWREAATLASAPAASHAHDAHGKTISSHPM